MDFYGLDLSEHNGYVDFKSIKNAGNSFVILRAGFATVRQDNRFNEYYELAKKAGLNVGAYWYSYALDVDGAKAESKMFKNILNNKQLEMPVYIDMEDADHYKLNHGMPSNLELSRICAVFCDEMEKAGYFAGIYASEYWMNNYIKDIILTNKYTSWVANWGSNSGEKESNKPNYAMHQFTSNYIFRNNRFDRNHTNIDFPSIIIKGGFNGFKKQDINNENSSTNNITNQHARVTSSYDYNGIKLDNWVLTYLFDVIEILGDRVVLGKGKSVTAAFNKKDVVFY